ncbi:hypothetical protein BGZ76_010480 [Entomortierella beljakovae]|nr:hypothetical protein BGZ76_010480 [Entomortierella beljakovae]
MEKLQYKVEYDSIDQYYKTDPQQVNMIIEEDLGHPTIATCSIPPQYPVLNLSEAAVTKLKGLGLTVTKITFNDPDQYFEKGSEVDKILEEALGHPAIGTRSIPPMYLPMDLSEDVATKLKDMGLIVTKRDDGDD